MSPRRYDITDFEWSIIMPLLPNKPRGVPRTDNRKVLNGIFWRLHTGSPWADIPEGYGPCTTCYNRFVRWRRLGVWDRVFEAVSRAYDAVCRRSIALRSAFISTQPTSKRGGGDPWRLRSNRLRGALAGRPDHQDPCRRRC